MKDKIKNWKKSAPFACGGMVLGYLYYRFVGCSSETCAIASNPWISMGYMALIGLLLSNFFSKDYSNCDAQ